MNFHDQVFIENDSANYKSVRQLQLWLLTIGHFDEENSDSILNSLELFCNEMHWELIEDEQLGRKILK
jgi:hypothetical protein